MDWRDSGALTAISTDQSSVHPANVVGACSIYYMPVRLAGPLAGWRPHVERVRDLGFTHICISPPFKAGSNGDSFLAADYEAADDAFGSSKSTDQIVEIIAGLCRQAGLSLMVDLALDRVAAGSAAAALAQVADDSHYATPDIVDPRRSPAETHSHFLPWHDPVAAKVLTDWWGDRMMRLHRAGAVGFRLLGLDRVPANRIAETVRQLHRRTDRCFLLGWTPGLAWPTLADLAGSGFDFVVASTAWWDGRASWYAQENALLSRIGRILALPEAPFGERRARAGAAATRQALEIAAATADGLFVPMGFERGARTAMDARYSQPEDLDDVLDEATTELAMAVADANTRLRERVESATGGIVALSGPASPVTVLTRGKALVLINPDLGRARDVPPEARGVLEANDARAAALAPGEVRELPIPAQPPITPPPPQRKRLLDSATRAPRIVIERLSPTVDGGRFPAKHIVGRPVTVEADVFMDGHDALGVELQWKAADEKDWRRAPMTHLGNDRWQASFIPLRIGSWHFTVEAWHDELATIRHAIELKRKAGVDVSVELAEERQIEEAHAAGATVRPFQTRHEPVPVEVERVQAEFASWYELFPRSMTDDPARPGTFASVVERLPRIRDMGFDVLYFPPIHPIGRKNRKGRNNSLTAAPGDVGSPYAIGAAEGGHDALHPELGTFEDFRRLIDAARVQGLEIAIDFAIQCSPDHPWLKQHPEWFRHRPDGTIKYAENPPKKYEDIVNVDFYAAGAVPALWEALRDVVLFWTEHGVRIFRVDNPHTKPLPFWQWMIADIRRRHPDAIFLAEAFTRPKMMYRLAKVGFSQSYTYFTWRNEKRELTEYLTELTRSEAVEFFRPHFFVNTPDINPLFLQTSGRPGFLIRAALATTLSGLWGMYSGFEICEAAPLPGREEYLDSEKYQVRVRDFAASGNIVAEITQLNRLRRAHPALQSHRGVSFYNADNDRVLAYGKALPSLEDMVFVLVSLDPHHAQETSFELPLWEWKLSDGGTLQAEDLMTGRRFALTGKRQRIRLDPHMPFVLWRLWPAGDAR